MSFCSVLLRGLNFLCFKFLLYKWNTSDVISSQPFTLSYFKSCDYDFSLKNLQKTLSLYLFFITVGCLFTRGFKRLSSCQTIFCQKLTKFNTSFYQKLILEIKKEEE